MSAVLRAQYPVTPLFLILLCTNGRTHAADNDTDIHLMGLFALTGSDSIGKGSYMSVGQAITEISHDDGLLPGYSIVLHTADSMVSALPGRT